MLNWRLFIIRLQRLTFNSDHSFEKGGNGCQFLGADGCILDASDRPIRCIAFTCKKLRKSMTAEQKKHYADSIRDLHSISHQVLNILKKEGKAHWLYGEFSLITTL